VPRTAAETRAHLLQVAGELFYRRGIRATGVDLVAAEAGVAPTTLYRLFGSKDDLVAAYVEHSDQGVREMLAAATEAAGPDPRDQILAIFDAVYAQVDSDRFRGCAMMMTLAEYPDADQAAHRNATAGKVWIRHRIGELTGKLPVDNADEVADYLTLALEGMLATGQALGPDGPARQARRLAEVILSTAAPRPDGS